jgi:recombination protein RecT
MSNLKLFQQENIKQKFAEVLGKQSTSFLVTVSSMISANDMLKDADPQSLLSSAMMAATLKLPVNQNL